MAKRKIAIGSLIAGGVLLLALVGLAFWGSTVFASGTKIAGVEVSYLTVTQASHELDEKLSERELKFNADNVQGVLVGNQFVTSDSYQEAVEKHLSENSALRHPLGQEVNLLESITFDADRFLKAVYEGAAEGQAAPVNAEILYENGTYKVIGGTNGKLASPNELEQAFLLGKAEVMVTLEEEPPLFTAVEAQETVDRLNAVLESAGFYVGEERLITISPDEMSSWLIVNPIEENGTFNISVDESKVSSRIEKLPGEVNRDVISGENMVNSSGDILRVISPSSDGYKLNSTEGLTQQVEEKILSGSGVFSLNAEKTPANPRTIHREIEVDLSDQNMVMRENGEIVHTLAMSSGKAYTPTPTGRFAVFAHVRIQDMGDCNGNYGYGYCTRDVPWVVYFAPDIAFHGAYWHNNFGQPMSHGCVNLPVDQAKMVYDWAVTGTEVWVHE